MEFTLNGSVDTLRRMTFNYAFLLDSLCVYDVSARNSKYAL